MAKIAKGKNMSYKNPILTEILVELYLQAGCLPESKMIEVVDSMKKEGLSEIEFAQSISNPDEDVAKIVPRIRCWDKDKIKLVQVSPDLIVVNQLKTYLGWSFLEDLVKKCIKTLTSINKEIKFKSISLNTIDRFSVSVEGFKLEDWLECNGKILPVWFKGTKEAADITLGRGFLKTDNKNRQILVQTRPKGPVIEVQLHSVFHDMILTKKAEEVLGVLHEESNATFEMLITDRVRKEIMGGEK
jgi:uncharacterized protein (TIGR04255 family)